MPVANISLFITDRKATAFLPLKFSIIFELLVALIYIYWDFNFLA